MMVTAILVSMEGTVPLIPEGNDELAQSLVAHLTGQSPPHKIGLVTFPKSPETEMAAVFREFKNMEGRIIIFSGEVPNWVILLVAGVMDFHQLENVKSWRYDDSTGDYTALSFSYSQYVA